MTKQPVTMSAEREAKCAEWVAFVIRMGCDKSQAAALRQTWIHEHPAPANDPLYW